MLNLGWSSVSALLFTESEAMTESDYQSRDENTANDYWAAAQGPMTNAITLTQQGTEFLLKAKIASVSPFLLISGGIKNWPKPDTDNKIPFASFRTIDAQDLLKAHDTACDQQIDREFQTHFDNLRDLRNKIIHTVDPALRVKPMDIWISILETSHHLIGSQSWFTARRDYLRRTPTAVAYFHSDDEIDPELTFEAIHLIKHLTPELCERFLGVHKKQRWYLCPSCTRSIRYDELKASTAQLRPKSPKSTMAYCFACDGKFKVTRRVCQKPDCLGNVIEEDEGFCLTCGEYNSE